jgi:hypothetical protein
MLTIALVVEANFGGFGAHEITLNGADIPNGLSARKGVSLDSAAGDGR